MGRTKSPCTVKRGCQSIVSPFTLLLYSRFRLLESPVNQADGHLEGLWGRVRKRRMKKERTLLNPSSELGKLGPNRTILRIQASSQKVRLSSRDQFKPETTDSDRSNCSCPPIPYYRCSYSIHAILPPPIASVLPLIISAPRLSCLSHYINHLPPRQYTPPTACQRPLTETQPSGIGR